MGSAVLLATRMAGLSGVVLWVLMSVLARGSGVVARDGAEAACRVLVELAMLVKADSLSVPELTG